MKKFILAIAAFAVLVPASSAMAADDLRLEGPSATLANLLTGGTSGGGPLVVAGQQIDGLQANGSARYRERTVNGVLENEAKVTANDVNATPDDNVVTFVVDTDTTGGGLKGIFLNQLNGTSYKLEGKSADGDFVPDLSNCGSVLAAFPLNPVSDIILATATLGGDPADLFLNRPAGC